MRRHQLTQRLARPLVVVAAALLVGASVAALARPAASSPVGVTISTAPGMAMAFIPAETTVAAPGSVDVTFRNGSSQPHNLVFVGEVTAATRTIVAPGTNDAITIDFPAPGTYAFVCTIHDGMAGVVIVEARPPRP